METLNVTTTQELKRAVLTIADALEGRMLCAIPLTYEQYRSCLANCGREEHSLWDSRPDGRMKKISFMGVPIVFVHKEETS